MLGAYLTAVPILALAGGLALAQAPFPQSPATPAFGNRSPAPAGRSTITSEGPATVTGTTGDTSTIRMPGGAGAGILTDNGSGTSTLVGPDGHREIVASPE